MLAHAPGSVTTVVAPVADGANVVSFATEDGVAADVTPAVGTVVTLDGEPAEFEPVELACESLDVLARVPLTADVPGGRGYSASGAATLATVLAANGTYDLGGSRDALLEQAASAELEAGSGIGDDYVRDRDAIVWNVGDGCHHGPVTLETTTRRATMAGRDVLLTDTVGFLDELPHWLVESFRGTLREVEAADVVLLVTDVAQPLEELHRKLETAMETLGEDHPPVVTALNKVDELDPDELSHRREEVSDLAPNPVPVSALEGHEVETLTRRVGAELPDLERGEFVLPLDDEAMSVVSWLHDEAAEVTVEYGSEGATVRAAAKPVTLRKARAKVRELRGE